MDFVLNGREYEVLGHGHPLSEEELCTFEAQIHTRLPPQLRSYYLRWNGGLPSPASIPMNSSVWVKVTWPVGSAAELIGPAVIFSKLFIINSESHSDFLEALNTFKNYIPDDYLCFSRDPGSSLFLIGIGESNFGKIFFWEYGCHANIYEGEIPDDSNIAYVADSFVEFLLALREEPDEDEPLEDWVNRMYPG
ncbi:SMI1/KNR4 family protein [Plasticicumulans acidivorans]|uniref:SMI1/KNR4 family protein SUKH-1 n=1 Tax=Plasticicumulans acidivorans TaxID=886464 RepID=A0A317MYN7_9GAMM|nr:SMI1/KNR4 family protein [Plasticicumulans acidivorans]PWV64753.1 SMI1/KNR4 family protein SUKH-1 [Plasticicumulans acidivorans]